MVRNDNSMFWIGLAVLLIWGLSVSGNGVGQVYPFTVFGLAGIAFDHAESTSSTNAIYWTEQSAQQYSLTGEQMLYGVQFNPTDASRQCSVTPTTSDIRIDSVNCVAGHYVLQTCAYGMSPDGHCLYPDGTLGGMAGWERPTMTFAYTWIKPLNETSVTKLRAVMEFGDTGINPSWVADAPTGDVIVPPPVVPSAQPDWTTGLGIGAIVLFVAGIGYMILTKKG
jgi:hypothetical protein